MKRIGILTGGGDAPALNAVIRGIVTRLSATGEYRFTGLLDGWRGLRDKLFTELTAQSVHTISLEGGTILGSSRTNLYKDPAHIEKAKGIYKELELDGLVAIGGDDTLEVCYYLNRDHGLKTIGVPKTIDNDVAGTDYTFGFWTAVQRASDSIDQLRTTAQSHHRVMVIECMGRHAGWITAYAGLSGCVDFIAVPEKSISLSAMCETIRQAHKKRGFALVVVAEGASIEGLEVKPSVKKNASGNWELSNEVKKDAFGNAVLRTGEIADVVANAIEAQTGLETRGISLGHTQRGGTPVAFDRILGLQYGYHAGEAVAQGKWGHFVTWNNHEFNIVPMKGKLRETQKDAKVYKHLPLSFLEIAEKFY